jgi:uncharacterized protein (TIGR02271 family)
MSDMHHMETDDRITVPLAEETLEATVTERERGSVRLHKRVETEPVRQELALRRDTVTTERIPRNEPVAARREPWYEEGDLMVPVYEEVPVTERRLVLREVIRVRREETTDQAVIEGEVRREVVEIERTDE